MCQCPHINIDILTYLHILLKYYYDDINDLLVLLQSFYKCCYSSLFLVAFIGVMTRETHWDMSISVGSLRGDDSIALNRPLYNHAGSCLAEKTIDHPRLQVIQNAPVVLTIQTPNSKETQVQSWNWLTLLFLKFETPPGWMMNDPSRRPYDISGVAPEAPS